SLRHSCQSTDPTNFGFPLSRASSTWAERARSSSAASTAFSFSLPGATPTSRDAQGRTIAGHSRSFDERDPVKERERCETLSLRTWHLSALIGAHKGAA